MTFLADFVLAIAFLLRGLLDALLGRKRRRYDVAIDIKAPRDIVWNTTNAREITFEGAVPISIRMSSEPNADGVYTGTISMFDKVFPMAHREMEMRPGVGAVIEIMEEGTAPQIAQGHDYFISYAVTDIPGGTRLNLAYELTHTTFLGRLNVPLGARQNARRIKAHCEKLAGVEAAPESAIANAAVTGAVTFASFSVLWGIDAAALLIVTILIHELGHALAMRMVGQPVRGIYFIPFFGGVAVGASPHASEGNRGFVALMGPGFSVVTTAIFYGLWLSGSGEIFGNLALMSAIINVINLVPLMPLDGGQVLASLVSRADSELGRAINFMAFMIAAGIALYFELYVMVALWLLTLPFIFSGKGASPLPPISGAACAWLSVGYVAIVAFYLAVITVLFQGA